MEAQDEVLRFHKITFLPKETGTKEAHPPHRPPDHLGRGADVQPVTKPADRPQAGKPRWLLKKGKGANVCPELWKASFSRQEREQRSRVKGDRPGGALGIRK